MTTGISDDLWEISITHKTAVINNELLRLQMDIAMLHETCLPGSGTPCERVYTFFWQSRGSDETRKHGVSYAMKNSPLKMVEPSEKETE